MNILVAGMRTSSTYHMRAIIDLPGGKQMEDVDHTFQTGAPPTDRLPQISVQTPGGLTPNPGVEQLDTGKFRRADNESAGSTRH